MGYESLDYAHARRRVNREVFLNIVTFRLFFQNIVGKIYIHLGRFNETVILLALVGYEMIIANEARSHIRRALGEQLFNIPLLIRLLLAATINQELSSVFNYFAVISARLKPLDLMSF